MISQETFNKLELEYGCGYWNLCWKHACPCAITVENKGLQQSIYDSMCEENRLMAKQSDIEDSYNDIVYDCEDAYEDERNDDYYECPFCNQIVDSELKCDCTWND